MIDPTIKYSNIEYYLKALCFPHKYNRVGSGLKKCYKERLMALKLPTLKYRRIRGDMIEAYKLLTNMYDDNTVQLDINSDTRTRGHTKKLVVRRWRYDVRKYSFSNKITNIWNSLPDEIISAPTARHGILSCCHGGGTGGRHREVRPGLHGARLGLVDCRRQ